MENSNEHANATATADQISSSKGDAETTTTGIQQYRHQPPLVSATITSTTDTTGTNSADDTAVVPTSTATMNINEPHGDIFDDPEDDDGVVVSSLPPKKENVSDADGAGNDGPISNQSEKRQRQQVLSEVELRRKKRRRLYRLLKNPNIMPSFLKAINAEPVKGDKVKKENDNSNETVAGDNDNDDDDSYLLAPPMVIIDVDEYLGLKKKKVQLAAIPDSISSLSSQHQIIPQSVQSSTKTSKRYINPAEEGYYEGVISMSIMPEDYIYLSEIQQWVRQQLEYFSATDVDVRTSQAGRRTPTVRGKVGIRCIHCAKAVQQQRNDSTNRNKIVWPPGSVSYPVNFAGMYSVAIQKPQLHFEKCPYMPADSRLAILLENSRSNQTSGCTGTTTSSKKRMKEGVSALMYWIISCHRIGLVETNNGIRFSRDLSLEPLPFETTRIKVEQENPQLIPKQYQQLSIKSPTKSSMIAPDRVKSGGLTSLQMGPSSIQAPASPIEIPKEANDVLKEALGEEDDPTNRLALQSDRSSLSDFMFLTIKQAAICHATKADFATRGKKTRLMRLGLTGFCCRHCMKNLPNAEDSALSGPSFQGSCRSFSSSSDNLASAMSNSFVLHLLKCPYTPQNIQQALQTLKRVHTRQMQQMPYGSQSRLFAELWIRMRSSDKPVQRGTSQQSDYGGSESGETNGSDLDLAGDEEYIPDSVHSLDNQNESKKIPSAHTSRSSTAIPFDDSAPLPTRGTSFPIADDEETQQMLKGLEENWDPAENDNLILPEDRNLVSDYVFLCMRQLRVALPTSEDFRGNKRNNILVRMPGMCCIHCSDITEYQKVLPSGRTFPSAPDNMASALNSSLYNHMLNCPALPPATKRVMQIVRKLHSQQCASLVFGSQRRFFNRVYARLKAVPMDDALLMKEKEPVNTLSRNVDFDKSLRECSFVYRGPMASNKWEYWQCVECRMVPFEYRAPDSLYFVRPSLGDMKRHAEMCQKDEICWDVMQASLKQLDTKYGNGVSLVDKESFQDLIRSVLGDTDVEAFKECMSKLGKPVDNSVIPYNSTTLWRRFSTSIDFSNVKKNFDVLAKDINLPSESELQDFPDIVAFLQLLQCNLQVPPREKKSDKVEQLKSEIPAAENEPSAVLEKAKEEDLEINRSALTEAPREVQGDPGSSLPAADITSPINTEESKIPAASDMQRIEQTQLPSSMPTSIAEEIQVGTATLGSDVDESPPQNFVPLPSDGAEHNESANGASHNQFENA